MRPERLRAGNPRPNLELACQVTREIQGGRQLSRWFRGYNREARAWARHGQTFARRRRPRLCELRKEGVSSE